MKAPEREGADRKRRTHPACTDTTQSAIWHSRHRTRMAMIRRHGRCAAAAPFRRVAGRIRSTTPSTQPAHHLGRAPRLAGSTTFAGAPAHGRWLRISPLSHFLTYAAAGPRAHDAASVCHGPAGTTDSSTMPFFLGLRPLAYDAGSSPAALTPRQS